MAHAKRVALQMTPSTRRGGRVAFLQLAQAHGERELWAGKRPAGDSRRVRVRGERVRFLSAVGGRKGKRTAGQVVRGSTGRGSKSQIVNTLARWWGDFP